MGGKAKVKIYRYGGRFLFHRITQECELSVHMARGIAEERGKERVEIEVGSNSRLKPRGQSHRAVKLYIRSRKNSHR